MTTLLARLRALPRALRWSLAGAAVIAGYLLVIAPALDKTAEFRVKADQLAAELEDQARVRTSVAGAARSVEQTVAVFGRPASPATMSEQAGTLARRVNAIFETHKVANQRASYRDPASLMPDPPRSLVGANQRIERVAVELSFECDLPTLLAVMTDLEKSPEIAAIARINIRKSQPSGRGRAGSTLLVNLAAEGWLVGNAPRTSRSAAPSATTVGGEP